MNRFIELEEAGCADVLEFVDEDDMLNVTYTDKAGVFRGLRAKRCGDDNETRDMIVDKIVLWERVNGSTS